MPFFIQKLLRLGIKKCCRKCRNPPFQPFQQLQPCVPSLPSLPSVLLASASQELTTDAIGNDASSTSTEIESGRDVLRVTWQTKEGDRVSSSPYATPLEVVGSFLQRTTNSTTSTTSSNEKDERDENDVTNEKPLVATIVDETTSLQEAASILSTSNDHNGPSGIRVLIYEGKNYGKAQQFVAGVKRTLRQSFLQRFHREFLNRFHNRFHKPFSNQFSKSIHDLSVTEQWKLHRLQKRHEAEMLHRILVRVSPEHRLMTVDEGLGSVKERGSWGSESSVGSGSKGGKRSGKNSNDNLDYIQSILRRAAKERNQHNPHNPIETHSPCQPCQPYQPYQPRQPYLFSLRELASRISADQWFQKGIEVDLLHNCDEGTKEMKERKAMKAKNGTNRNKEMKGTKGRIHPHFNVYPPTRQEYLRLLCGSHESLLRSDGRSYRGVRADLDGRDGPVMMDVGCGTGILSTILLHRHPDLKAVLTDVSPLAIDCARDNLTRLGLIDRVVKFHLAGEVGGWDGWNDGNDWDGDRSLGGNQSMFAEEEVDLLVCNPPWIPELEMDDPAGGDTGKKEAWSRGSGGSNNWLDRAIYDDANSSMLFSFLRGAASHMRNHHNHSNNSGKRNRHLSEAWLILSDLAEHLQLRSREELLQAIHDGGLEIVEMKCAAPKNSGVRVGQRNRGKNENIKPKRKSISKGDMVLFPKVEAARQAEMTYLYRLRKRTEE